MEKVLLSKMESQFSFFGTMSLLYGILFTACMYQNWNGATFPVLVVFTNLFGFQYVKQIGLKIQKDTWVYAAGMILLSISSFMTTNTFLIFFNWIGIFLLFVVMMIHQFYQDTDWSFQVYLRNILMIIGTTVGSIFYPIRHAAAYITPKTLSRKRTVLYIFSGVAIAACLLLVILPLLVHSDQIFALYFGRFTSHIRFGNVFWIFVMAFTVGILCYAFFSALCRKNLKSESEVTEKKYSPVVAITFTSVIAVIYLFYSAIQIIYLFIGQGGGLPAGITYASYARSGFWELLFISILNFFMVVVGIYLFRENKILKWILTVISACTFVMIFSSAYRMWMYVDVYHLTFLRVLVLWFLSVLTIVMIGTIFSIYKKKFPLFRYSMFVVGCCYIVFSLARPDYWIATYNIEHTENMNQGELSYLVYGLSDDAASAISKIEANKISLENDSYLYYDDSEKPDSMLQNYFWNIKEKYRNMNIRTWNYAKKDAALAAEQYLGNK